MQKKTSSIIIALLLIIIGLLVYSTFIKSDKKTSKVTQNNNKEITISEKPESLEIDELTSEKVVIPYVKAHNQLPDYYITKEEARNGGWIASEGNLCDVLPGKAIGGDRFSNREKRLSNKNGRTWREADLNYNCGRRNADRLLFSNDGLIFVTYDHYKTFEER